MPELPDITLYIEALRQRILGRRLERSRVRSPFLLRSVDPPLDAARGAAVAAFERLGKRIAIGFDVPLDREIAQDPDRWALEQWNYRYSEKYGSDDWSVAQPDKKGHDAVELAAVRLSDDGRVATLEIPALTPVHQLRIRGSLKSAAGAAFRLELAGTIRRVPPK